MVGAALVILEDARVGPGSTSGLTFWLDINRRLPPEVLRAGCDGGLARWTHFTLTGSREGKMLREVLARVYGTLHWGAHMEHLRPGSGPRASSVRLAHPV
ncbi:hypothetical protein GCM10026982_42840 [Nocardiopsis aegyptia]